MAMANKRMLKNAELLREVEDIINRYDLRNRNPNEKIKFEGFQKLIQLAEFKWTALGGISEEEQIKWGYEWYCLEPGKKDVLGNWKYTSPGDQPKPEGKVCERRVPNLRIKQIMDIPPTKDFPDKYSEEFIKITGVRENRKTAWNLSRAKRLGKTSKDIPKYYTVGDLLEKLETAGDVWQGEIFKNFVEGKEYKVIDNFLPRIEFQEVKKNIVENYVIDWHYAKHVSTDKSEIYVASREKEKEQLWTWYMVHEVYRYSRPKSDYFDPLYQHND